MNLLCLAAEAVQESNHSELEELLVREEIGPRVKRIYSKFEKFALELNEPIPNRKN